MLDGIPNFRGESEKCPSPTEATGYQIGERGMKAGNGRFHRPNPCKQAAMVSESERMAEPSLKVTSQ